MVRLAVILVLQEPETAMCFLSESIILASQEISVNWDLAIPMSFLWSKQVFDIAMQVGQICKILNNISN